MHVSPLMAAGKKLPLSLKCSPSMDHHHHHIHLPSMDQHHVHFYHGGDHYDVDPLSQIFSKHCNVRNNSQVLSLGQTCPNPNQFPGRPMAGSNHRCLFSSKSDPKISDRPETPNTCPDKICSQQPPPEFGFGDWVKEDSY